MDKAPKPKTPIIIAGPRKSNPNSVFLDKTDEYGLKDLKATHLYAVDFDNDLNTDLVVLPTHYSSPIFFRYLQEEKKFKKLDYNPFSEFLRASYLYFDDFNKDGVLDVIVGTLNQKTELNKFPLRIFQGIVQQNKLTYTEVKNAFPTGTLPTASIAVLDYDLDGYLDIYEANWFDYSNGRPKAIRDRLLRGSGFKFADVTGLLEGENSKQEEVYINARPTFGVGTCDINQDGRPDIMSSSSSGLSNKLWVNIKDRQTGRWIYRDFGFDSGYGADSVGKLDPTGGGNSFFAICADYNNDGIMDILSGELAHSYDAEKRDRSSILTGATFDFPPNFIRTEYHLDDGSGAWSQGDRRGSWFDYNVDGLMDIIVDNSGFPPKSRLVLFHQEDNHAFTDMSEDYAIDLLNPSGSVVADFNNDGLWDFVSGQTDVRNSKIPTRTYLFENQLKRSGKRSMRFFLRGEKSNALGIGSMLMFKSEQILARQWVSRISGGLPSQNAEGILFGMHATDAPEFVEVRWPFLKKNQTIRTQKYSLKKFKFKEHLDLTLCESGKILLGRQPIKKCKESN